MRRKNRRKRIVVKNECNESGSECPKDLIVTNKIKVKARKAKVLASCKKCHKNRHDKMRMSNNGVATINENNK